MATDANGYWFTRDDLPTLQIANYYPERTARESGVLRDFLNAHGDEFERFGFSVRVGASANPDSAHLIGVQKSTLWSNRKRIDLVCQAGTSTTLVEAKMRLEPSAIGQLLTYRLLWMEDNPDAGDPALILIGRYTDGDTVRSAQAHGINVYIYDRPDAAPGAATVGV